MVPVFEHVGHLNLRPPHPVQSQHPAEFSTTSVWKRTLRTSSNAAEKAENASCTTLSTVSDLMMCWNARSFRSCSPSSAGPSPAADQSDMTVTKDVHSLSARRYTDFAEGGRDRPGLVRSHSAIHSLRDLGSITIDVVAAAASDGCC